MPSRFSFQHQRGLSLVELLVGIAIGMIVLVGATQLFVNHVNNNRQLVLETRVNRDLRAAADLIARDVRRSGYWGNATAGVHCHLQPQAPAIVALNGAMTPRALLTTSTITYNYSQGTENNALDSNEQFGFRLNNDVLQYLQGGSWQDITDSSTLTVNTFSVTPVERCLPLQQYCTGGSSSGCSACTTDTTTGCPTNLAACATCPFIHLRSFNIVLQGTSNADSRVVRRLEESVRVRNDQLSGQCP